MHTAPILLGSITAPAKMDLQGMDTIAQVKQLQARRGKIFNSFLPKNSGGTFEPSTIE